MMTPSRKLYYAVEAVIYIAYQAENQPVSSRDIARMQGLPARHLEQIMQRLVHGRILRGMRGPRGGYLLAKAPEDINLAEICHLVNEDDVIHTTPETTPIGTQVLRPFWNQLHKSVSEQLQKVSIADLCQQAATYNVPRPLSARLASGALSVIVAVLLPLHTLSSFGVPYV